MTEENAARVVIESPIHGPAVLAELARLQGQEAAHILYAIQAEASFSVDRDNIDLLARSVAHERAARMDALHDHALTMESFFKMADAYQATLERESKRLGVAS